MKSKISFILLSAYLCNVCGLNLPGPLVYVVTPSPRPRTDGSMSRASPFYYHNWMRRMDPPINETKTTTTTTERAKTQDLIFAEFESDNADQMKKSIRKLLEKERIEPKSTTLKPKEETVSAASDKKPEVDSTDYFALYNNLYNNGEHLPMYLPSTTVSTTKLTTTQATTTPVPTTSTDPMKVENIWHIIDNEKYGQYSGNWEEIPVESGDSKRESDEPILDTPEKPSSIDDSNDSGLNDNFALPGFGTNPGNGAENESRAIRTESNVRFPYVNLKPFVMKPSKSVQNSLYNNKKVSNMFGLNDFKNNKQPVRGEAQDLPMQEPIDRYNPAQPHLPSPEYGSKSKQSSPNLPPVKTYANLVPPPLPPIPKVTGNDFPTPNNYESFPPYAPSGRDQYSSPPIFPPLSKPISVYEPPEPPMTDDSDSDIPPNDGQPMDLGYRYKPPAQTFLPTIAPQSKPFSGYSYDKPPAMAEVPAPMDASMDDMSNFQGYHYNKPTMLAPPPSMEHSSMDHEQGPADDDHSPPESYGHHDHHDHHHSYGPHSDYPELIFDKPHSGKGGDSMKEADMGMVPPPPDLKPDSMPPMDDSGFPSDFPGDFKYHHDFDHDHHVEYHHHPPPTTTETPRVNRFSYYYLGKKLYYLPLYFSVYFIVYVGALIIKAVLRHKIVYPNSWRPNDQTASFFSKRSIDSMQFTDDQMHNITGRVTRAIASAAEKYLTKREELKTD